MTLILVSVKLGVLQFDPYPVRDISKSISVKPDPESRFSSSQLNIYFSRKGGILALQYLQGTTSVFWLGFTT